MATARSVMISMGIVLIMPMTVRAESLVEKQFALFDINRDGGITQKELTEAANQLGLTLNADQAKNLMAQADQNQDNSIDIREFQRLADSIQKQ